MSSHCGLYPSCNCPSDIGRYCGTGHSLVEIATLNQQNNESEKKILVMGSGDPSVISALSKVSDVELIGYEKKELVFKTDGNSNLMLVQNPDRFNLEGIKIRRKHPSNFTPKKKKRKKK